MKPNIFKIILIIAFTLTYLPQYGQIVADHTVVDKFDDIPQYYLDKVKTMLFVIAGESHSRGYGEGLELLEALYPKYDMEKLSYPSGGTPGTYLRYCRAMWGDYENETDWIGTYGEEDWFTNSTAISRTKAGIAYCNTNGYPISALGFGWCYDAEAGIVSSGIDPVYGVHWYGNSNEGPEGDKAWGIDDEDNANTGNSVNMDSYLEATQAYIDYCTANNIPTKVFFTTGPVDTHGASENSYQAYLKWEHLRDYVSQDPSRILFDYADILCYDDDGTVTTTSWNGHTYPHITPTNLGDGSYAHIGQPGELRLGKALWWMLARIAGWNGVTASIPVTNISVTGNAGSSTIFSDNGTLQLTATVTPSDASNKTVTWSIQNGSGKASISSSGLVTAISTGTVTARATANDGSGVFGTLVITISNQIITVTGITVTGAGSATTITTDNGTLQLTANVSPSNASNKTVTWSVQNGTGQASINSSGLVTAIANGTVTARATANDGSGVYGQLNLSISNQISPTNITEEIGSQLTLIINQSQHKINISKHWNSFSFKIYNINGVLVYTLPIIYDNYIEVLKRIEAGLYLCVFYNLSEIIYYKISIL